MKKFGFATITAAGMAAAVSGLAAPAANADVTGLPGRGPIATGADHLSWIYDISPTVEVTKADTSVSHNVR
jgi:phosphoribosylcarboxyaminoimidazole (NCAIR) mutase